MSSVVNLWTPLGCSILHVRVPGSCALAKYEDGRQISPSCLVVAWLRMGAPVS